MKICTKCNKEKELDDFAIKKGTLDGLAYKCKECQNEYGREHYLKNKKQYSTRNKRRAKEARDYIQEVKEKNPCRKCGEKRWWVLEFHHKSNDKYVEVSKLIGYGIVAVKREIKKCEVLCSNCHKDLHYNENKTPL